MGSIASIIAQGPRPTDFGILTPNQQQEQRNTLDMQRAQIAMENARIKAAQDEAEQRARAIAEANRLTAAMRSVYEQPRDPGQEAATEETGVMPAAGARPPMTPTPSPGTLATAAQQAAVESTGIMPTLTAAQQGPPLAAAPAPAQLPPDQDPREPETVSPTLTAAAQGPPATGTSPQEVSVNTPSPAPAPSRWKPPVGEAADEAVVQHLIKNGAQASTVDAFRKNQMALHENAAKLTKAQLENRIAAGAEYGKALEAAAASPPEMWPQAKADLERLHPGLQLPDQKPPDAYFTYQMGLNDYTNKHLANLEAAAKPKLTEAQAGEAQAKMDQAKQTKVLGDLASAAKVGEVTYNEAYQEAVKNDPRIARLAPHPANWDEEDTPAALERAALSPEQREKAKENDRTQDRIERHQKEMEKYNFQRNDLLTQKLKGANSTAMNQAHTEFSKAVDQEKDLTTMRGALGAALATGKTYVDKNGKTVSMDKASGGDPATAETLVQEMKNRFISNGGALKEQLRKKYGAAGRLGMDSKVPLEKALSDIDTGTAAQFAPPAPAPGAVAPPATVTAPVQIPGAIRVPPASEIVAPGAGGPGVTAPSVPIRTQTSPSVPPLQANAKRPTAIDGAGRTIVFDGRNWVDPKTGKPVLPSRQ